MKAREFLAQKQLTFTERDLIKAPLTAAELGALIKRVEAPLDLVKPNDKKDAEGMSAAETVRFLVTNPNAIRRPIIDTGTELLLGFTPAVRAKLGG